MTETSEAYVVTPEELADANAMLSGPVLAFEPASSKVVAEGGELKLEQTDAWIKLGVGFRGIMRHLKGAKLSVFIAICLHVNQDGAAWPGIRRLCEITGYETKAVTDAVQDLANVPGLLEVTRRAGPGQTNVYRPAFASYGDKRPHTPEKRNGIPQKKGATIPPITETPIPPKSETKEEPIEEEPIEDNGMGEKRPSSATPTLAVLSEAGRYYFTQAHRKRWASPAQAEAFESAEREVGPAVMLSACEWAAIKGITDVARIAKAARKIAGEGRKVGAPVGPVRDPQTGTRRANWSNS